MKNILKAKYGWIWILVVLFVINGIAAIFYFRLDLTQEHRYTLSAATRKMLTGLEAPVDITLFLSGDMPAGFKKLAKSSEEMLQSFKEYGKNQVEYTVQRPGENLNETARAAFIDSLNRLGLAPMNVKAQMKEGEGQDQRLVYPGALVTYKGRVTAVDFLQGQSFEGGEESLNKAEALLEYKLAGAINKLSRDTVPRIGYLSGNGESLSYNVADLINTVKANYQFNILPIENVSTIPEIFNVVLITKPTQVFTDQQKLKIDQYIMHGGKVMWMIDNLYAEFDSLQRSQNEFIAFDRNLNLEDQLFKYGARINLDLVQDLTCDQIPSVIGTVGGKPQIELVNWYYFPLLSNTNGHPIAKNLDYVVSQFPNSIDTIAAAGIKKTVLLSTSPYSRILSSPAKVSWKSVSTLEDEKAFTRGSIPIAVLLEGEFTSLFNNRLTTADRDSLLAHDRPFVARSAENKMIVISDGDIAYNAVNQQGPMPMGKNMYTGYQYANKEFIFNCLEYLTDRSGILETRSKDYTLRLLDKKRLAAEKLQWQIINIAGPAILIILFAAIYQVVRKRKYSRGAAV